MSSNITLSYCLSPLLLELQLNTLDILSVSLCFEPSSCFSLLRIISSDLLYSSSILFLAASDLWLKPSIQGFPGGAVVENLPANAGDAGLRRGLGRSHMPRSNQAREPQLLSLRVWSLCSTAREATIVRGPRTEKKSGPRLPQLEKALAQKRRPNTAKNE